MDGNGGGGTSTNNPWCLDSVTGNRTFTATYGPPAVTIDSTSPATINGTGSSTITWHADADGTFSVRVGGTNCTDSTQVSSGSNVSGNYNNSPNTRSTAVNASALSEGANTIRVCVTDSAGGTGSATTTVTKDATPPKVLSIIRLGPPTTSNSSVSWLVIFSESVSGVNIIGTNSDFALANTGLGGTPAIQSIAPSSGSSTSYTVTASTGTGSGTLGLNLTDNDSITDGVGNRLGGTGTTGTANGSFTGDVFTIDRTAPNVVIDSTLPATINGTGSSTITWHANENGTYSVRVGGTNCSTGTQVASGNYTTQPNTTTTNVNAADLANGPNTVRVCVTDAVGPIPNTGSATTTITYNPVQSTSVGDITASTSTYGGTTNLSAKVSPTGAPGSVEFYVNGSMTPASGTVTYDSSTGVATLSNYAHGLPASTSAYSVKAVFTSSSANYTNSDATNGSALAVNKRAITVTPDTGQSKVYGTSPDPTLTYHLSSGSLASGDNNANVFSGALSRDAGETVAGSPYAITKGTLAANSNYDMTFDANGVTFAITARPITVTADNKTKQLGATDPALTYTVTVGSLASGDNNATVFNGALSRDAGETVAGSPYAITKGTLAANSNYNMTFVAGKFYILYSGGFLGIQQPINGGMGESIALTANSVGTGHDPDFDDDNSRFKLGSTVPVKFELRDATGAPVTNAIVNLTVKVADNKPDPGVDEPVSTSAASSGNAFRLSDATTGQYIFNLSTKSPYTNPNTGTIVNFTSQGTYTLSVLLNDGTSRSVNIQLVK